MGGQFNYWGFWLDSEYGRGECAETCTTFKNYNQLSASKNFEIRNIEVWAVGEKPVKEEVSRKNSVINHNFTNFIKTTKRCAISFFYLKQDGSNERSILDGNLEEKAILEMVGRRQYSEGYREEPVE